MNRIPAHPLERCGPETNRSHMSTCNMHSIQAHCQWLLIGVLKRCRGRLGDSQPASEPGTVLAPYLSDVCSDDEVLSVCIQYYQPLAYVHVAMPSSTFDTSSTSTWYLDISGDEQNSTCPQVNIHLYTCMIAWIPVTLSTAYYSFPFLFLR